jgi:hypothetical protein
VFNGRIIAEYFTKNKEKIEEYNPEVDKSVYCEWILVGSENKIIGEALLKDVNSQIYCPSFLKSDVTLNYGDVSPSFKTKHLYFSILNKYLCLKINLEMTPVKLLLSRNTGRIDSTEIEQVESKFGKRTIIFKIPSTKVSAFDNKKDKYGHTLIEIQNDSIIIHDLESKNKTYLHQLSMDEADHIRINNDLASDKTSNESWEELFKHKLKSMKVISKNEEITGPALINLANQFFLLVL